MSLDKLPINLFDFLLAGVLLGGILRGRKIGMSGELLPLFKWLAILVGCSMVYQPAGDYLAQSTGIFSLLACYLLAYVGSALIILMLFSAINKGFGGKLVGSDIFGRAEYY